MGDYEHFRAFLHSRALRWSYGAIKGRAGDAWQKGTANLPAEPMVSQLLAAGFEAIYVDRHGFDDNGVRLEEELSQSLGRPVLVSPMGASCFSSCRALRLLAQDRAGN